MGYNPCEGCSNNPKNNPYASGICHCALPAMMRDQNPLSSLSFHDLMEYDTLDMSKEVTSYLSSTTDSGVQTLSESLTCGNCNLTDGCIYTSYPPKVRCEIDDSYHFLDHRCDFIDED